VVFPKGRHLPKIFSLSFLLPKENINNSFSLTRQNISLLYKESV